MYKNTTFNSVNIVEPEYGVDYKSDEEMKAVILFQGYPQSLLTFAFVCCVLFVLIGIPGNLTTIIALANCRKIRNATAIFIINLQICDLMFCCSILPFIAATFANQHWIYGIFMCRTFAFVKFSLNAVSILITVAIAVNRYVMVCHPVLYPKLYKKRNLSIMILSLWVAAFASFLPSAFGIWGRYNLDQSSGFCTMLKDKHNRSPKTILMLGAFIGPYTIMALCYARLWWVVRKTAKISRNNCKTPSISVTQTFSSEESPRNPVVLPTICEDEISITPTSSPRETDKTLQNYFRATLRIKIRENRSKTPTRRDKRLCTMIIAVMLTFCLSHIPVMLTKLVFKEYRMHPVSNILAHLLEYSGACINPIIYVLMSKEYRQAYLSLFGSVRKRFQNGQVVFV